MLKDQPARQVRTRPQTHCILCGNPGDLLFANLPDRLFAAPDLWDLKCCPSASCGLIWLDPMPLEEDIGKLYESYYTHPEASRHRAGMVKTLRGWARRCVIAGAFDYPEAAHGWLDRRVGPLLACLGPLREIVGAGVMWLSGARRGRLLDVGCGNGKLLRDMRDLGWQVSGVDPDPKIAGYLRREHDLDVRQGTLESAGFPRDEFDVVTMNHVIEHLPDPRGTLTEVMRLLKPGGRLVVATPNIDSMARHAFSSDWVHWDPPRHLYLFSTKTLPRVAEGAGLRVEKCVTSARLASWTWAVSRLIRAQGHVPGGNVGARLGLRLTSILFHWRQHRACRTHPVGEDLLMVAVKQGTS